ncbi:MAG: hypothetical protein Q9186_001861 [Xanthomendoza sp. 1 TL-2023]
MRDYSIYLRRTWFPRPGSPRRPPPEASRSRLLAYLTEFLIHYFDHPEREAYELARKFSWDGYLLYRFSPKQFNELQSTTDIPDDIAGAVGSSVVLFDATAEGEQKDDENASSDDMSWPSTPSSRANSPSVSAPSETPAVIETSKMPAKQQEKSSAPESLPQASQTRETPHPSGVASHSIAVDCPVNGKPIFWPAVPHPDAPLSEVREFLTAWFINIYDFSEEEGLKHARKFEMDAQHFPLRMNAGHLYACSCQRIEDIFGTETDLYYALQFSKYGKLFNIWHYIPFIGSTITFLVTIHNFNTAVKGQFDPFVIPTLGATIFDIILNRAFHYCSSAKVLENPRFPERCKGRSWCVGEMDYGFYFKGNLGLVWMIPFLISLWSVLVVLGGLLLRI